MASYSSILRKNSSEGVVSKNQRDNGVQTGVLVEKNYCDRSTGRKQSNIRLVNSGSSASIKNMVNPPKVEKKEQTATEPKNIKDVASSSLSMATPAIWQKCNEIINSQVLHRTQTTHTLVADYTGAYYLQSQTKTQSVINNDQEEFPSLEGARQTKRKDNRNRSSSDDCRNMDGSAVAITKDLEGFPTLNSARHKKPKERLNWIPAANLCGQTELSPFAKPYVFKGFGLITAYDDAFEEYSGYCEEYADEVEYEHWREQYEAEHGGVIVEGDLDEMNESQETKLSANAPPFVPTNGIMEPDENDNNFREDIVALKETSAPSSQLVNLRKLSVEAEPFEFHRGTIDFNGSPDHKSKSDDNMQEKNGVPALISSKIELPNAKHVSLRRSEAKEIFTPRAAKDSMELRPSRNTLFNWRASSNKNTEPQVNESPIQLLDEIIVKDRPKLSTDDTSFDYRSPLYNRASSRVGNSINSSPNHDPRANLPGGEGDASWRRNQFNHSYRESSDPKRFSVTITKQMSPGPVEIQSAIQKQFDDEYINSRHKTGESKYQAIPAGRNGNSLINDEGPSRSSKESIIREFREKVYSTLSNDRSQIYVDSPTRAYSNAQDWRKIDNKTSQTRFSPTDSNCDVTDDSNNMESVIAKEFRDKVHSVAYSSDTKPTNKFGRPVSEEKASRITQSVGKQMSEINSWRSLKKSDVVLNRENAFVDACPDDGNYSKYPSAGRGRSLIESNVLIGQTKSPARQLGSYGDRRDSREHGNVLNVWQQEENSDSSGTNHNSESLMSPSNSTDDENFDSREGHQRESNDHQCRKKLSSSSQNIDSPDSNSFKSLCEPSESAIRKETNPNVNCELNLRDKWHLFSQNNERHNNQPVWPQNVFPFSPISYPQGFVPIPMPFSNRGAQNACASFVFPPQQNVFPVCHPSSPHRYSNHPWAHLQPSVTPPHAPCPSPPISPVLVPSHLTNCYSPPRRFILPAALHSPFPQMNSTQQLWTNLPRTGSMPNAVTLPFRNFEIGNSTVDSNVYSGQIMSTDANTQRLLHMSSGAPCYTQPVVQEQIGAVSTGVQTELMDGINKLEEIRKVEKVWQDPLHFTLSQLTSTDSHKKSLDVPCVINIEDEVENEIQIPPPVPPRRSKYSNQNRQSNSAEIPAPLTADETDNDKELIFGQRLSEKNPESSAHSLPPIPNRHIPPKTDFVKSSSSTISSNSDNLSAPATSSQLVNGLQNNNEAHSWLQKLQEKVQTQQANHPPIPRRLKDADDTNNNPTNPFRLSGNGRRNLPKIPARPSLTIMLKDPLHSQPKAVLDIERDIDSKKYTCSPLQLIDMSTTLDQSLNVTNPFLDKVSTESPKHTPVIVPPRDALWFYIDPRGERQGPFTSIEMVEWSQLGYFNEKVQVRRDCDKRYAKIEEFEKLTGSSTPFLDAHSLPSLDVVETVTRHSTNPFHNH